MSRLSASSGFFAGITTGSFFLMVLESRWVEALVYLSGAILFTWIARVSRIQRS